MLKKDLAALPDGYVTLYDLSRRKGYDLCGLVRAADLGDIETHIVTLRTRPRKGRDEDLVQARIVRGDTIAPTYVARVKFSKKDDPKERFNGFSVKRMGEILGVSKTAIRSYLEELGMEIDDILDQETFDGAVEKAREVQAKRLAWSLERKRPPKFHPPPKASPPEGYLTISQASKKWGIADSTIYNWAKQGKVESIKVSGRMCVKDGQIPRRPWEREDRPEVSPSGEGHQPVD